MRRRIAVLDETGRVPEDMLPPTPAAAPPLPHPDASTHAELGLALTHDHPYEPSGTVATHAQAAHGLASHAIDGAFHSGTEVLPTTGQKNALAGSSGIPGTNNPYVTTQDARMTDARTPAGHVHDYAATGHTHASSGGMAVVKKAADQAFTAVALASDSHLLVPLAANADVGFEFLIVWQSAATTTGVQFALSGPAGLVELAALVEVQLTAATWQSAVHVAYDSGAVTASIDAANTRRIARIKGVVRNGANAGNLVLRCRTEVNNSAITVKRGSFVSYA